MSVRSTVCAAGLVGLVVVTMWMGFAQEATTGAEAEAKAAVVTAAMELVNAALARDVEGIREHADMPLLLIEGIGGRAVTVKDEELEGFVQMVYVPAGIVLEPGTAEVSLMGKTASAQIGLVMPGGPDLGLSGRCAFMLVNRDGKWKVKAAAYYGY
jgi:hypothetical protein